MIVDLILQFILISVQDLYLKVMFLLDCLLFSHVFYCFLCPIVSNKLLLLFHSIRV